MTHITLSKKSASKPSLEFYSDDSGKPRRVTIEQFPYRIGRTEAADLRIESAEVSREHVEIVERNGMWLVRDLGSTNGTQVNGKPIKETLLTDGDILKIAEIELTFIASSASQFQRMVTQPIHVKKSQPVTCALPPEVAAARTMTEATLWQAIPTQLFGATSLRHGVVEALFAPRAAGASPQSLPDQLLAVGERYRELARMRAIELAHERSDANVLFLAVGATEIETPHRLFSSLRQLQGLLPNGRELGITMSLPTDVDILRTADIYSEARDQGLLISYDEFLGNGGQAMHLESQLPDYLVLSANMTKDLVSNRQAQRRLESLRAACEELAVKPVLPASNSGHALVFCQEAGFDLVLQPVTCKSSAPAPELSVPV